MKLSLSVTNVLTPCFLLQNSVKAAYRCLWPSCGKVLTSVVGIKRHIRTTHLWWDSLDLTVSSGVIWKLIPAKNTNNIRLIYVYGSPFLTRKNKNWWKIWNSWDKNNPGKLKLWPVKSKCYNSISQQTSQHIIRNLRACKSIALCYSAVSIFIVL